MAETAKRDVNYVPVITAVTDDIDQEVAQLRVNPTSKYLKIDALPAGSNLIGIVDIRTGSITASLPTGSNLIGVVDIRDGTVKTTVNVGTVVVSQGSIAISDGATPSIKATVLDYASSNPLAVRLTDTGGDYVSGGGGTQYNESSIVAPGIGNLILGKHYGTNQFLAFPLSTPQVAVRVEGLDSSVKITQALPAGTNIIGSVVVTGSLPTGLNTIGGVFMADSGGDYQDVGVDGQLFVHPMGSAIVLGDALANNPQGVIPAYNSEAAGQYANPAVQLVYPYIFNGTTWDRFRGVVDIRAGSITAALPAGDNNIGNIDLASAIPAGSNLIGQVIAGGQTSSLYAGTTELTPKYAAITITAQGSNQVVAGVASKKIRVLQYGLVCGIATSVMWRSATATNLSGSMQFAANGGISASYSPVGLFETGVASSLALEINIASVVGGHILYVEI